MLKNNLTSGCFYAFRFVSMLPAVCGEGMYEGAFTTQQGHGVLLGALIESSMGARVFNAWSSEGVLWIKTWLIRCIKMILQNNETIQKIIASKAIYSNCFVRTG